MNTKYISSGSVKISAFSLVLSTRENFWFFHGTQWNIFGIHPKKVNILHIFTVCPSLKIFTDYFSSVLGAVEAVAACFVQNQTSVSEYSKQYASVSKFPCTICGKLFWSKADVRRHMVVHTGEKPYKCDLCGKRFNQKAHLKCHQVVHYKQMVR